MKENRCDTIVYLNSNSPEEPNLLACGSIDSLKIKYDSASNEIDPFDALQSFIEKHNKWVFGYLGYDLKNAVEDLKSSNHDGLGFPDLFFFVPKVVYAHMSGNFEEVAVYDRDYANMCSPEELLATEQDVSFQSLSFTSRTPKEAYLQNLSRIKNHIQRGDIYEANYCVEFFHENVDMAPMATYWSINELTNAPYSAFFAHDELVAISGSPELYLEKKENTVLSKPIKGTARRGVTPEEDLRLIDELKSDQKERSENVMIVDLVRNDLSKISLKDSVKVQELCEIYSFDTVHQMISTIRCEVDEGASIAEILRATFPMGSMTGAPKVSAMELMEKFEDAKRGLYSGAIGFVSPEGDFAFNVVIRTLLYNQKKKYLSLMAGGAITINSDPEKEYRECLLKASALKQGIYAVN